MDELKACPFCGSHNVKMFYDERQNYHIECYGCNKTVSFHIAARSSLTKAIDIYNRRTQQENKPLSLEELRQMDGDKIYIRYINHCNGIYEDAYAPYFGNKEQFVHRYNGTLRACDLPLKYLGIEWQAFIHKPKQEEKNNVR